MHQRREAYLQSLQCQEPVETVCQIENRQVPQSDAQIVCEATPTHALFFLSQLQTVVNTATQHGTGEAGQRASLKLGSTVT